MSRSIRRTVIFVVVVAALVALALPKLVGKNARNRGEAAANRDPRIPVRTQVIRPEKLSVKVATVGTILPNEEVNIRSEISGKIDRVYFQEGSEAKKGEVLIKINDDELQAQFLRAKHRQALVEQQERRQRQLFQEKLVTQDDFERATTELNIAKAEAQLIQAQIDKTEIRAPFDGTVGLRYVSEGGYVTPTTRITSLQDSRVVKVDFTVPEKYASAIKTGDTIQFTTQGSSRTFRGTIYALESDIDSATRTLHVRARSANDDGALRPGSFANIQVVLEEKEALMIPSYALIPELKGHRVFLLKEGKAVSQPVEIGTRTEERVEITQGMKDGDRLITSAILQLRPGTSVRLAD